MDEPAAGGASDREETGSESSKELLDALEKFVVQKAKGTTPPEPKRLTFWQYVALFLFCANVIIGYLSITSLLPSIEKQPFWTVIGKIVPLIIGSTLLMSWAGEFQDWILKVSSRKPFLLANAGSLLVIGLLGMTQLPRFTVAINPNKDATSFCVEPVDDLDDVRFAALRSGVSSNPPCPKPQMGGTQYLKSLRLLQDYGVTVLYASPGRYDNYFLSKWEVLAGAFRFAKSPLALGSLGTLTLPAKEGATLHILPREGTGLIYVPSDVPCGVDEKEITCYMRKDAVIDLPLMPGDYLLKSGNCKVTPEAVHLIEDQVSNVECK